MALYCLISMEWKFVMSDNSTYYRAAELLRTLANQRRLAILEYLCAGERSVGELERLVGLGQSALSQHLARLRRARLVGRRRVLRLAARFEQSTIP